MAASHFANSIMRLHLSLLSPLLLLAACASQPATPPVAEAPAACNADAAQRYVGQPASEANVEAVRAATGSTLVRSLKPGQAATMDYRSERVNVLQDAAGNIERITCG